MHESGSDLIAPQPLTPTSNMLTWWTSKNVKTLAWFSLCWHIHVHRIQTFQYSYIPYLFICIYKGIYIYAYIYTGTCRNLSSWKHRFFNEAGFWRTCWKGQKRKPNDWWNSRFATVPASLHRPHELHNKKPFLRVYRGYVSRSMVFLCYWNRGFDLLERLSIAERSTNNVVGNWGKNSEGSANNVLGSNWTNYVA